MNLLANELPIFFCLTLLSTGNTGNCYYTQSFYGHWGSNLKASYLGTRHWTNWKIFLINFHSLQQLLRSITSLSCSLQEAMLKEVVFSDQDHNVVAWGEILDSNPNPHPSCPIDGKAKLCVLSIWCKLSVGFMISVNHGHHLKLIWINSNHSLVPKHQ